MKKFNLIVFFARKEACFASATCQWILLTFGLGSRDDMTSAWNWLATTLSQLGTLLRHSWWNLLIYVTVS